MIDISSGRYWDLGFEPLPTQPKALITQHLFLSNINIVQVQRKKPPEKVKGE